MSSPEEPYRPVPPRPGHEPAAGHPAPGQPPTPYYAAPSGPPAYGPPPGYGPPGGSPYGGPALPPPKKSRKALWIVLGIVGGVLVLVAAGAVIAFNVVGGATNQARGIADDFTELIIAGDVNNAYDKYLDPALMQRISREEFAAGVQSLELDVSCKPNYSTLKVSSNNGTNAADVAGFIDCDTKRVELVYRFEGRDELKMVNIRLRPQR